MNQVVRKYYILLRVADLCWDFEVLIFSALDSSPFSNVGPLSRNTPERNLEGSDMRCKICIKQLQLWTWFSDRQTILPGKNNTAKKWIKLLLLLGKNSTAKQIIYYQTCKKHTLGAGTEMWINLQYSTWKNRHL